MQISNADEANYYRLGSRWGLRGIGVLHSSRRITFSSPRLA